MMRTRQWAAGAGVALAVAFGLAGAGVAQTVTDVDLTLPPKDLCRQVFASGAFDGFLPKGEVAAGEPISIGVEWQPTNVVADKVDLLGCASINGQPAEGLATLARSVDNDGEHHLSFLLPDDLGLGAKVCERSAVIGPKADITRTPASCFSVASAKVGVEQASPPARQSAAAPAPAKPVTAPAPAETKAAPAVPTAAPPESKNVQPAGPAVPEVAGAAEERAPGAAAPETLARTGSPARALGALAGTVMILGGLAVAVGGPKSRRLAER